jgi:5-methylthioadenosine/S-adenosylhomocysteine deaminase
MTSIDSLIVARHVVPVEPRGVLLEHAVAIDRGRIVGVVPAKEARARFTPKRTVELSRHVLIPGLVNLHCHAAMTLFRGLADDTPLMTWLEKHIWPAEARHVNEEFVHDGSVLAMAEMLRGGVTCVNDMYFHPDATARAALRIGMRAMLGIIAIEFPSAYATDAASYLKKGFAARETFRGEPLLSFCLAPHAPYTVADGTLKRIVVLADELDLQIHCHVNETRGEIEQALAQHGNRPVQRLWNLGVVGPRLIAVHSVHLDGHEIDLFARHGVSVAHCPSSNMKLASGIAPVAAMRAHGINVGLGTDGAASNNRLDLLTEMRTAALLAKVASGDAAVLNAGEALAMATIEPARALALDKDIGSIAVGKLADLAAIELASVETLPVFDPVSHIAYSAGREHVSHVWVAGEPRVADGRLVDFDERDLHDRAIWWQARIQ